MTPYVVVPTENGKVRWEAILRNYHAYGMNEKGRLNSNSLPPPAFIQKDHFTPIEWDVWTVARGLAFDILPQYPSEGYFLDFANPFLRLAIECDGRAYHSGASNKARDEKRDTVLCGAGWSVLRIDGSRCVRLREDPTELAELIDPDSTEARDNLRAWLTSTPEGILTVLADHYKGESYLFGLREIYGDGHVNRHCAEVLERIKKPTSSSSDSKIMAALSPLPEMVAQEQQFKSISDDVQRMFRESQKNEEA